MRYRTATPLAVAAAALLVVACSGTDDPDGGPSSATVRTLPSAAPSSVTPPTTDMTDTTAPTSAPTTTTTTPAVLRQVGDPSVAIEPVASFDTPVDLTVRPGDDALWVVEQAGRIVRFDGGERSVALDLTGRVSRGNEQGLLGLAFSPDGAVAYTNHTDLAGTTVVSEFSVGADGAFDEATERTVLAVEQPFSNHNAGDLEFGPDGMLYVPLGDGGSSGDPRRTASDPATLLGSLLRIDPTPTADAAYTIPSDNPFAQGPFDGIDGRPEVWSWGLRNPWKIAFDPVLGDLWVPDVGQDRFEEINVVRPVGDSGAGFGVDFGWSAFEGTERFDAAVPDRGAQLTPPVLVYDHGDGCSISGGAVYRGTAIPELEPAFVYSDYCAGAVWAFDLDQGRNLTLVEGLDSVTAIREGPDAELYVVQRSGEVLRLVAG